MSNAPNLRKEPTLPGRAPKQNMPIPQAITLAAQKVDAGELQHAEAILNKILLKQPENPHATHLLGIIAHRVGRSELGLAMIGKAM